jgi:hypothetical protein
MLTWALRLIDSDHRATLLPDPFTGSPADALAHGRDCLAQHRDCEHLQLESETFNAPLGGASSVESVNLPSPSGRGIEGEGQTGTVLLLAEGGRAAAPSAAASSLKFEISDLKFPAPTSLGGASSVESSGSLPPRGEGQDEGQTGTVFDLNQRPRNEGWTLSNLRFLAYPMWYLHWRDAMSYAAFTARGSEILIRISDANSVCRKLVLIVPAAGRYADGLRFPQPVGS